MSLGFDVGTYNLVCCRRTADGNFDYDDMINAFIEVDLADDYTYNMMSDAEMPLIKRTDVKKAYGLGANAVKMAYALKNLHMRRPMKDGCVNPQEVDAFEILNIMVHNLIGEISSDREILYYSVPANAINEETDANYHGKLLGNIFNAYRSSQGWTVDPRPINEGMALVYAELKAKKYCGLGISFGAGMVNVAFGLYGTEAFKFSIVNSGDWIDKRAAKVTGKDIPYINKKKMEIDLSQPAANLVDRAIAMQYELMIEATVTNIKQGLDLNTDKSRLEDPVDIVISGGTASPPGFKELFEKIARGADLPLQIGEIIRPQDPLYSVALGCLLAAESASKG